MALRTHSVFYYGHTIDETNRYVNFKEGAGLEKIALLPVGTYTLTKFLQVFAATMNAASALDWTASVNRATRIVTITSSGTASLLGATGSNFATSVMDLLGLGQVDYLNATSFVGSLPTGKAYAPQFPIQDYVPKDKNKALYNSVITRSASGDNVSVQSFGEQRIIKGNIKWVTNLAQDPNGIIRNDPQGVENLTAFLDYAITKAPVEFMEDENDRETFDRVLLESTPSDPSGTSYELKEYFDRNLPEWFESTLLTFRIIKE